MSTPHQTLAARVPWSKLATELDIHVRTMGLPAATQCPLCKTGVVRVYRDALVGGEWFHCQTCRRQGDMIELAAAVWNLGFPDTVSRLGRLGFELPDSEREIRLYVQQRVEYRQRLQKLWDSAAGWIDENGAAIRLAHHAGLYYEAPASRRQEGPEKILRFCDAPTVERCFAPGSMSHASGRRPRRCNPSGRALFTGGGWKQVFMVPYYDLPWRICAFAFIGRRGDPDQDFVFKRANVGPASRDGVEAGLAMHPQVLEASERWDSKIIAMSDLVPAWRLQLRHLEQSPIPLPLVVWHDSQLHPNWHAGNYRVRTRHAWKMLASREIVFWMPGANQSTFEQAIRVNGKISTVGPRTPHDAESLREYCWKQTPDDLTRHILDHTKPWAKVLSDYLDTLGGLEIEDVLAKFEISGLDVDEILRKLNHGTRLRVVRIRAAAKHVASVTYEGKTIIERDDKWYCVYRNGTQSQILGAVLRVDAMVYCRQRKEIHLAGRVIYEGQEVEFCALQKEIEKDPGGWIDRLLMSKITAAAFCVSSWSRHLLAISQAFQYPETVVGVDRVGYDKEQERFVLPQFTIEMGGEVKKLKYPVFPEPVPAAKLQLPEVLSPEEIDRVKNRCNEVMTEVFWATAACVLANILARVYHLKPYGIALQGYVASEFGREVARALGCIESCPHTAAEVKWALLAEQRHDWPMITEVSPVLQRKYRRQFFEPQDEGQVRNCIAAVDWVSAKLLGMQDNWHTISTTSSGSWEDDTLAVAKLLIPAYLKNLRKRQLDLGNHPNSTGSLVGDVLQDLARYAKDHYGDPDAVLSGRRAIEVNDATNRAEALADLLDYFIRNRKLDIREQLTTRRKPALIEHNSDGREGLLLPCGTLDKLVKESPVPPPSMDQVYRVLDQADVLLDEDDDGVVFRRDWFDERCRLSRAQQTGMLKVMG